MGKKIFHVWDIFKEHSEILSKPPKTKYITKEDNNFSENDLTLKMDKDNKIKTDNSLNKNYIKKLIFHLIFSVIPS